MSEYQVRVTADQETLNRLKELVEKEVEIADTVIYQDQILIKVPVGFGGRLMQEVWVHHQGRCLSLEYERLSLKVVGDSQTDLYQFVGIEDDQLMLKKQNYSGGCRLLKVDDFLILPQLLDQEMGEISDQIQTTVKMRNQVKEMNDLLTVELVEIAYKLCRLAREKDSLERAGKIGILRGRLSELKQISRIKNDQYLALSLKIRNLEGSQRRLHFHYLKFASHWVS